MRKDIKQFTIGLAVGAAMGLFVIWAKRKMWKWTRGYY